MNKKIRTGIYLYNGVSMILPWRGESDHAMAVTFFRNLEVKSWKSQTRFGEIDFYELSTEEQFESLMNFRARLKEQLGPIPPD